MTSVAFSMCKMFFLKSLNPLSFLSCLTKFLALHAWWFYTEYGSFLTNKRGFPDVNIFFPKNWKQFLCGWSFVFIWYQALVKGGASSQTMTTDEFIVGAAEVLLEQVWPVFVLCHVTPNSSLLSMQSASLVIDSELSNFCFRPCFRNAGNIQG